VESLLKDVSGAIDSLTKGPLRMVTVASLALSDDEEEDDEEILPEESALIEDIVREVAKLKRAGWSEDQIMQTLVGKPQA